MQYVSQAPMSIPVRPIVVEKSANDEKLDKLREQAEKIGKHIKYCAYFFLVSGVIGLLQSIHCYASAHKWAKFIVEEKKLPWGHHAKHHKHHEEAERPGPYRPHFLSEDQWLLHDLLKNIGTLSFIIFAVIFVAGLISKKIVKTQK